VPPSFSRGTTTSVMCSFGIFCSNFAPQSRGLRRISKEHSSRSAGAKLLECFRKWRTTANHGRARFRFRKPSLYPAELRDRGPAGQAGAWTLHTKVGSASPALLIRPPAALGRNKKPGSGLRLDAVLAHDLPPDAHLLGEERREVLGVGEQERQLLDPSRCS
jgi:hypothetical protein